MQPLPRFRIHTRPSDYAAIAREISTRRWLAGSGGSLAGARAVPREVLEALEVGAVVQVLGRDVAALAHAGRSRALGAS